MELCKLHHIPFRTKVKIQGREIDFLIKNLAIEIDSHPQDPEKNSMLFNQGYTPIHLFNWDIKTELVDWLKQYGK